MQNKLNTIVAAPNQIWEHIVTGTQVIIERIDGDNAYCALMNGTKVGNLKVFVPVTKFMCWGDRGMAHIRNRKGRPLKVGTPNSYGTFNPRRANLGAK